MAEYVSNKKLLEHLIDYKERKKHNPDAQIDDYIAQAIVDIANKFASRPNFAGYTYREDMVSDAIENVLRYIDNFDPEKSSNPFAYITQICHYAFLRRIKEEKTQMYVRLKSIQKHYFEDKLSDIQEIDHSEEGHDFDMTNPLYENMQDFIDEFEEGISESKRKSREYNRRLNDERKQYSKSRKNKHGQIEFE